MTKPPHVILFSHKRKSKLVEKKGCPHSPTVEGSEDIFQKNNNNKPTSLSKKSSNSHKKGSSDDNSEIEVIEKPQGSPEEELGMWIKLINPK